MGMTDKVGHYELIYLDGIPGAKVGAHKVTITTPREDEFGAEVKNFKERVPAKYNASTTLAADVKAGTNEIDFQLSSKSGGRK